MYKQFQFLIILIISPEFLNAGGKKFFSNKKSTESYKISTLSWGQNSQQSAPAVQTNSPGPSSSSSSSTDSDLQKNRFARLSSRPKINIQTSETENKPADDVPVLQHGNSRLKKLGGHLTVKIPPPEKNSKEEYPALKSSSSPINNFGERLSLKKSNSATFDNEEYPALRSSKSPLQSLSPAPMERSSSLRIPKPKNPHFIRGGSVGSNPSPKSSPGTSWSSLTSFSGRGRSPSLSPSPSGSFSSMSSSLSSPGLGRSRKLSDLSLVPAAPVTVNDQTCKEDSSPAEQCFNFFTFSIFWPPALGYEYLSKNKPVNDNINLLKWSIHGLWPSSYTGVVPENCKKRTSVTFNQHRFQREKGLRTKLETKWFNICPYKQHGCSMTSFWNREFSKHGACASRSSLISSDLGYFKMAVNMMDRVNMAGIFINSGFKVGDKLTYGEIVDIVNDAIGIRVKVEIVQNKAKNVNYLKEIRVCYNLQLHPINCPGTKLLTQEIRSREIIYLDHVPKLD